MKINPWIVLFVAGLCEIVWAVAMDYSEGFSIWYCDIIVAIFLIGSTVLLAKALNLGIPVGTAYAVWTGIGAVGTMTVSVILGNETLSALKVLFIAMIIGGIIGLQLSSRSIESS